MNGFQIIRMDSTDNIRLIRCYTDDWIDRIDYIDYIIRSIFFLFFLKKILSTFILEISRLKRQKSFVVDLYQQKLNQIIDVENKLDNEVNKWQTYRL